MFTSTFVTSVSKRALLGGSVEIFFSASFSVSIIWCVFLFDKSTIVTVYLYEDGTGRVKSLRTKLFQNKFKNYETQINIKRQQLLRFKL
jgi:hypothetical protein